MQYSGGCTVVTGSGITALNIHHCSYVIWAAMCAGTSKICGFWRGHIVHVGVPKLRNVSHVGVAI